MAERVPILGQHHMFESFCQIIDDGNDFIAAGHGEVSALTEIILDIYYDKDIIFRGLHV